MAEKRRTAKQKAATRKMIAANRRRAGTTKGKRGRSKAKRSKARKGGGKIPLPILKARLLKLSRVIQNRTS